jgi:nitroreductase
MTINTRRFDERRYITGVSEGSRPETTMTATTADALLKSLSWRYATKKFDASRKIPEATWKTLEQALLLAPSSYGLQPWRFYVVTDAAVRVRLREAAWNQPQITDASHLVVLARRRNLSAADVDRFIDRIVEVRHAPRESLAQYRGMMVGSVTNPGAAPGGSVDGWAARQVYIALGFFLSAAAMLDIDACPMEGFDPARFDQILGLEKDGYAATVLATAGYRADDDSYAKLPKVRATHQDVIKRV